MDYTISQIAIIVELIIVIISAPGCVILGHYMGWKNSQKSGIDYYDDRII